MDLPKTAKDHTGRRFGRLVALEYAGKADRGAAWRLRCDCGRVVTVPAHRLTSGHRRSCGCLKSRVWIGQRYSRLLVTSRVNVIRHDKDPLWRCRCDCGSPAIATSRGLLNGKAKSCGCLQANPKRDSEGKFTGEGQEAA